MVDKTRSNLTSLERLERQLQAITPSRAQGDAWEKALKGWINAGGHPELTKAWMWGEWPGKLKAGLKGDKGVDLVAETRDKQLVAIQVKFRENPNDPVTAPEVQKLVGSYRKHFTLFALASNAWSATRGVSEAVGDEDAMLILREQLLESSYDWAAKKSIKRTKFAPFPFQKVAAENVRKALAKGGRAQIVMACGTGKTVTMLLAAEALDAQRVLVLAPTLLLVKQLRDEWVSKRRPDREWASLAVCSDIGDGVDASEIAPAEFGAPPTTNPDEIAAFLKKPGRRVVFGTYASSDRIAKAQKKAGVPSFDLAVADEAHRIAGVVSAKDKSERSQRVMLEEKEIKAVRRLFATATPRITGSKKTREGDEILIESMDDESRFGKVAHSVTFQEAVKLKRLVPYKLIVTIVTNDEVADAVQNRQFIDVNGKPYAADEVATAIAIRRAYKDLGVSKIISYHSRVAGARAFADLITQVPGRGKPPVTEHVAGSMPVNDRRQVLNRLAAATEPYLVTNARCLTEGIDVPALDGVAFADPRKSQVDIVQAVGRAMRRPMGTSKKTTGYIILPVYLTKKELKDPETAVEGSAFEPVLQVLRALKDHDPFMARFLARVLVEKGKKPNQVAGAVSEILEVSIGVGLNKLLAKQLLGAVQLRTINVLADRWSKAVAVLDEMIAANGSALVRQYDEFSGFSIGTWANETRSRFYAGALSKMQIHELESKKGWVWNLLEYDWDQRYLEFLNFVNKNGHANPTKTESPTLNQWRQSQISRRNELSKERLKRIESIPGWNWDTYAHVWNLHFLAVKEWCIKHKNSNLPQHEEMGQLKIGAWAHRMRQEYRKGKLSEAQISSLETLPSWQWSPKEERWESMFAQLQQYVAIHGDAAVPARASKPWDQLAQWVQGQRSQAGKISSERRNRLESLKGWSWDKHDDAFLAGLTALKKHIGAGGNLQQISRSLRVNGIGISSFMTIRRGLYKRGILSVEHQRALEALKGWTWDPKLDQYERTLSALLDYMKRNGSVPVRGVLHQGVDVGQAAKMLRHYFGIGQLEPEVVSKLERIKIWTWDPFGDRWEGSFLRLQDYVRKHQTTSVKREIDRELANWAVRQRMAYARGSLSKDQISRLESIPGWLWDRSSLKGAASGSMSEKWEAEWQRSFTNYQEWARKNGPAPSVSVVYKGTRLRAWLYRQIVAFEGGTLSQSRLKKLNLVKGWKTRGR